MTLKDKLEIEYEGAIIRNDCYQDVKESVNELYKYIEEQVNIGNISTINILDDIKKHFGDFDK